MKVLGIIVEYNPMHTGHVYHIQKAKERVHPDYTIAIMSGNYVQRGEVAIIDKMKRSELAINYGVDLVVELPFVYVSQSADYFCKGAIEILSSLGVTDIVFGSECGTIETFVDIAQAIKKDPDLYNQYIKEAMKNGLRYPDACNQALSQMLGKSIMTPNDLLGLGYVKEVINHNYPITMHCITRTNNYHETSLEEVSSATALRKALKNNENVDQFILDRNYFTTLYTQEDFFPYLKYVITMQNAKQLATYHLVDEGLENLMKKNISNCQSYDAFVESLCSKRYTKTRIQRMLLHVLMQNTTEEIQNASDVDYIRILKMNKKGQAYISSIKKTCPKKIISNYANHCHHALDLEFKATRLLSLLDETIIERELKNRPIG